MLKELLALWKQHSLMTKVVEEFRVMLQDCEYVFGCAWSTLRGEVSAESVKELIHEKDVRVNKAERHIRRMLVEHLSVNPGQDVSGCLVMMSLVKDAERIGDYSKNIFDLGLVIPGPETGMKYFQPLDAIHARLKQHLAELPKAFKHENTEIANAILNDYPRLKEECSRILDDVLADEGLSPKEAVVTALLSRHLKRINSHVSNIASGMVYPVDRIDFVRGGILD